MNTTIATFLRGPKQNRIFLLQSQPTQFCNKPTEVGAGNNPALTITFTETAVLYYRCLETGSVSLIFQERVYAKKTVMIATAKVLSCVQMNL